MQGQRQLQPCNSTPATAAPQGGVTRQSHEQPLMSWQVAPASPGLAEGSWAEGWQDQSQGYWQGQGRGHRLDMRQGLRQLQGQKQRLTQRPLDVLNGWDPAGRGSVYDMDSAWCSGGSHQGVEYEGEEEDAEEGWGGCAAVVMEEEGNEGLSDELQPLLQPSPAPPAWHDHQRQHQQQRQQHEGQQRNSWGKPDRPELHAWQATPKLASAMLGAAGRVGTAATPESDAQCQGITGTAGAGLERERSTSDGRPAKRARHAAAHVAPFQAQAMVGQQGRDQVGVGWRGLSAGDGEGSQESGERLVVAGCAGGGEEEGGPGVQAEGMTQVPTQGHDERAEHQQKEQKQQQQQRQEKQGPKCRAAAAPGFKEADGGVRQSPGGAQEGCGVCEDEVVDEEGVQRACDGQIGEAYNVGTRQAAFRLREHLQQDQGQASQQMEQPVHHAHEHQRQHTEDSKHDQQQQQQQQQPDASKWDTSVWADEGGDAMAVVVAQASDSDADAEALFGGYHGGYSLGDAFGSAGGCASEDLDWEVGCPVVVGAEEEEEEEEEDVGDDGVEEGGQWGQVGAGMCDWEGLARPTASGIVEDDKGRCHGQVAAADRQGDTGRGSVEDAGQAGGQQPGASGGEPDEDSAVRRRARAATSAQAQAGVSAAAATALVVEAGGQVSSLAVKKRPRTVRELLQAKLIQVRRGTAAAELGWAGLG